MNTGAELLLERVREATADEYTIERELGRGGMAAVFLAKDKALDRRVAIKVMLPDLVDVEGISDRFVIEAKTAAHLDHPGIVTVYSVKHRSGLLFIVMKFIEGRTLDGILKSERMLDASVTTAIVAKVAEALHFAHGESVIHRDVKPSNIIIDTKGRPIVTDFGIAKVTSARSITVTGSMLGTPTYMSPEQCRGLQATAASDQYSLGVMMYEMLTGKVPFTGTIFELINAHCTEAPPPMQQVMPGVDQALEEIVMRMLAKNPLDRFESLSDVAKRLTGGVSHHRSSAQVNAAIVAFATSAEAQTQIGRKVPTADISGAPTQLQTTPAPGLVVTPSEPSIEVGQTIQLRCSEPSGASLVGVRIVWRSEDPTIATVDENGLVTGRSVGFAKITASGGAAIGRSSITVTAQKVDTLVVTPQSPEFITGNEIQFVATALDSRGERIQPDPSGTLAGQTINWQSSDISVCAVSSQGRAIGMSPGSATITALCGSVRGTATARVKLPAVERVVITPGELAIEAEESRKLTAAVYAALDRKLDGRKVQWRSQVPNVVSVDADGNIKGISAGTAAVIATCEGKDGIASISVRNQPVVAVRISPEQLQLEIGKSLQLKGSGEDRRGRAVSDSGIAWHSDDDHVALVDASGKVHGVKEGKTIVRAMSGDASSSISVTIIPRAAAQIRIDSHQPTLQVGEFLTLSASVLDSDGGPLNGRDLTWTSSNPSVISIDNDGACEAKKPGSVLITAACERARATTKIAANAVPVVAGAAAGVGGGAAAGAASAASAREAPTREVPRPRPSEQAARDAETTVLERPERKKRNLALPIGAGGVGVLALVIFLMTRDKSPDAASVTQPPAAKVDSTPVQKVDPGPGTPPDQKQAQTNTPPQGKNTTPPDSKQKAATPSNPTAPPLQGKQPGGASTPVNPPAGAGGSSGSTGGTSTSGTTSGNTGGGTTGGGTTGGGTTGGGTTGGGATGASGTSGTTGGGGGGGTGGGGTGGAGGSTGAAATSGATSASGNAGGNTNTGGNTSGAVTPPAGRGSVEPDPAARAAACANPVPALNDALGSDPKSRLAALYAPRDANDAKAKTDLINAMKDARSVATKVTAVRPVGDPCEWEMQVELNMVLNFGRKNKTYRVRLALDVVSGSARARNISSAVER